MERQNYDDAPSTLQSLKTIITLIASIAGIVIILYGFKLCLDIFTLIYSVFTEPKQIADIFNQWAQTSALTSLKFTLGKQTYSLAHITAIIIGGGCALLLAWLAIAIMQTGAKIVYWTSDDQEAIKTILKNAFGPGMKPVTSQQPSQSDSKKRSVLNQNRKSN